MLSKMSKKDMKYSFGLDRDMPRLLSSDVVDNNFS